MTSRVTGKPDSGEDIIERSIDPVFGERYTPKQVFWNFLDELTNAVNSLVVDASDESLDFSAGSVIGMIRQFQDEFQPPIMPPMVQSGHSHSISTDYTTIGSEVIEVTAACDITLNTTPDDEESVTVYINGGVGATLTDGVETDTFTSDATVTTYTYNLELGEWVRGL